MPTDMTPAQPLPARLLHLAVPIIFALVVSACGGPVEESAASRPPTVGVISVQPEEVHLTAEFAGRLEPWRIAEVRAQVSGIVLSREFTEGATVEAGQTLFQIDPAPYRAKVMEAESNLAVARANLLQAKAQYDRVAALGKVRAVSELDEITAEANYHQAQAQVEAARAVIESARVDLDNATVKAPISGRIGRSMVTEGALVDDGGATHMATIRQTEPIYASFNQGSADALRLRASYAAKSLTLTEDDAVPVSLILEDGTRYRHGGHLLFGEASVEPSTGQINYRAEIPNPDYLLMPGMYVRVILEQALYPEAFLIPQKAVTRNEHGDTVLALDDKDTVTIRLVTIAGAKANHWIVTEGLEAGDRVVVDGFYKVAPGRAVTPLQLDTPTAQLAGD